MAEKPNQQSAPEDGVRDNYETLAADLTHLRDDFKLLREDIAALGAAGANRAKKSFKDGLSSAEEEAQQAMELATTEFQEIQRQAEKAVRKKPLTAVLAAVAIGYFAGGILRK